MIVQNNPKLNPLSNFKTVAAINQQHKVYLVQHQDTRKFYVRKDLGIYSTEIYKYLMAHPVKGIPHVLGYYDENNGLTVIEEFVSGRTLQELIDSRETDILTVGEYVVMLCEILDKLHSHNPPVIHRDIKPSNIIITAFGDVVLIDFNAARFFSNTSGRERDTKLLGTEGYAAPEQFGFGESSPQTDIYSIGKLLKESVSILSKQDNLYDNIIDKCTKIEQSKRYHSVNELKKAIIKCLNSRKDPKYTNETGSASFLPPGFRTGTPWKIITSMTFYIFFALFCASLSFKNSTHAQAVIEKITIFIMLVSYVFIIFDYGRIRDSFPLCRSDSIIVRIIGVLLLMVIITFGIFFMMLFIFSAFKLA